MVTWRRTWTQPHTGHACWAVSPPLVAAKSHGIINSQKKKKRWLTIFISHGPSGKESKLSDSHRARFSMITLGSISTVKCIWTKDRGFSASSWASPFHMVQKWQCQDPGVTTGAGEMNNLTFLALYWTACGRGDGAFCLGWMLCYNLTVLCLLLHPCFDDWPFYPPILGEEWWMFSWLL